MQNNVSIVAALVIAFYSSWRLALLVMATFPFLVLGGYLQVRMTRETPSKEGKSTESFANAGGLASESLRAIRTVTAFALQSTIADRFSVALQETRRRGIIRGWAGGISLGISQAVIFLSYAVSFYYGCVVRSR